MFRRGRGGNALEVIRKDLSGGSGFEVGQKGLRGFQRRRIERRQLHEKTSEPQRTSQFDQSKLSVWRVGDNPQREAIVWLQRTLKDRKRRLDFIWGSLGSCQSFESRKWHREEMPAAPIVTFQLCIHPNSYKLAKYLQIICPIGIFETQLCHMLSLESM